MGSNGAVVKQTGEYALLEDGYKANEYTLYLRNTAYTELFIKIHKVYGVYHRNPCQRSTLIF